MRLAQLLACWFLLASAMPGSAQTSGTITGMVIDASGAVVDGAAITARNTATGLERTARSGGDGRYVLAGLPAGDYELRTTFPGFHPG